MKIKSYLNRRLNRWASNHLARGYQPVYDELDTGAFDLFVAVTPLIEGLPTMKSVEDRRYLGLRYLKGYYGATNLAEIAYGRDAWLNEDAILRHKLARNLSQILEFGARLRESELLPGLFYQNATIIRSIIRETWELVPGATAEQLEGQPS